MFADCRERFTGKRRRHIHLNELSYSSLKNLHDNVGIPRVGY